MTRTTNVQNQTIQNQIEENLIQITEIPLELSKQESDTKLLEIDN